MSREGREGMERVSIQRETVQVRGIPVCYEVAGQGDPLVLVHGFAESTRVWYRNLPELSEHYRVYLVDLPGFGSMRRFHRHFQLAKLGAWLDSWRQAVGLEEIALVGHSMGGYIAMAMAAERPEKVKHLALVDSLGAPLQRSVVRLMGPALKAIARATPSPWLAMSYDSLRAGPLTLWRVSRQIVTLDTSAVLAAVNVPTLLIWGENDDLLPFDLGRQLHTHLSQARLCVIQGANHFCMYEQPDLFNQTLLAFLRDQHVGVEVKLNAE